jgi:hypothetical protein
VEILRVSIAVFKPMSLSPLTPFDIFHFKKLIKFSLYLFYGCQVAWVLHPLQLAQPLGKMVDGFGHSTILNLAPFC